MGSGGISRPSSVEMLASPSGRSGSGSLMVSMTCESPPRGRRNVLFIKSSRRGDRGLTESAPRDRNRLVAAEQRHAVTLCAMACDRV